MNTTELIVLALATVMLIAAVLILFRRQRTQKLRSKFGPEYGRAVQDSGGAAKAEARLQAREKRVGHYGLRPLTREERQRFESDWRKLQGRFVDNPKDATALADTLLGEVMSARGYPPDSDFDRRLEDLSVDHAQTVQNYRAAHDMALRHARGEASTEDMRQAMIHYRTLFDELVDQPEAPPMKAAS